MKFILSKNTKIIILFLILIILLLIFIYLDKNKDHNKTKETLSTTNNNIIFSLITDQLNKDIKIKNSIFLSYDNNKITDITNEINEITSTDYPEAIELDNSQKQEMKMLVNNISENGSIYAIPRSTSGTTFNRGFYKFTVIGKDKNDNSVVYNYNITGNIEDFKEPFFINSKRGDTTYDNSNNKRRASAKAHSNNIDTVYFLPDSNNFSELQIEIIEDYDISQLDISLVWTGTNEIIEPSQVGDKIMNFNVDKHITFPGSIKLKRIENNIDIPIIGNYDNRIGLNYSGSDSDGISGIDNVITINSANNNSSVDLIYKFNDESDISKIGIIIIELETNTDNIENITVNELINNILDHIIIGSNKRINKNSFTYEVNSGYNASYLVLIKNDLYSKEVIINWLDNNISSYSSDKYFICGFEYIDSNNVNNNTSSNSNANYISLGCYNDKDINQFQHTSNNSTSYALDNKLNNVDSVDDCYNQAVNDGYKYFGLKRVPDEGYEVIFSQHVGYGGAKYKYKVGEYSDVTPGTWDTARPGYHGDSRGTKIGYRYMKHRGIGYTHQHGGLSSVVVPEELIVTIYSEKNFGGENYKMIGPFSRSTFRKKGGPGGFPAIFNHQIKSLKVELNVDGNNECWAGNDWTNASRLGATTCEKDGGENKIYIYSVGNNIPDNYASDNNYKCANYGESCDCNGFVKMGPRYKSAGSGFSGGPGEWQRGERDFDITRAPYKVIPSNGSVVCHSSDFGNPVEGWGRWAGGFMQHLHCWCMNDNYKK